MDGRFEEQRKKRTRHRTRRPSLSSPVISSTRTVLLVIQERMDECGMQSSGRPLLLMSLPHPRPRYGGPWSCYKRWRRGDSELRLVCRRWDVMPDAVVGSAGQSMRSEGTEGRKEMRTGRQSMISTRIAVHPRLLHHLQTSGSSRRPHRARSGVPLSATTQVDPSKFRFALTFFWSRTSLAPPTNSTSSLSAAKRRASHLSSMSSEETCGHTPRRPTTPWHVRWHQAARNVPDDGHDIFLSPSQRIRGIR